MDTYTCAFEQDYYCKIYSLSVELAYKTKPPQKYLKHILKMEAR